MTEVQMGLGIVNLLMLIVGFFMRQTLTDVKEHLKDHKKELDHIKESYFKRADFTEFKQELFERLDRDHAQILREIVNK
jgi:hypothetical protein